MNDVNDENKEVKKEEKESIYAVEKGLFGLKRYRIKWNRKFYWFL